MTDAQKARRDANDAARELRALALDTDSTSEDIEKANKKLHDLETRAEALDASEPVIEPVKVETEDAEARELRSLIEGSNAGDIFAAAVDHGAPEGRTAELQQHFKLPANAVPLVLLEQRAVATVPADIESTTAPTMLSRCFAHG